MNQNKRITPSMIVGASASLFILLLFFLPLQKIDLWVEEITLTCANLFPKLNEIANWGSSVGVNYNNHYLLLTMYLIPLFVLLTLIMFATRSKRATYGNFLALCIITITDMLILLIYSGIDAYDAGKAMGLFLEQVSAVYWLMLLVGIGGIIAVGILHRNERGTGTEPAPIQPAYTPHHRRTVLACIQGEYAGSTIEIPPEGLMIGRDPSTANLIMAGGDVSRRHCYITHNPGGGLSITDYSSVGTFVDGKKLVNGVKTSLFSGQKLYVASKYQVFEVRDI